MFQSYLTAALRNLARNALYTGINVTSLAIGLTAALLVGIFVRDELSYDKWLMGYERIYLVSTVADPRHFTEGNRDTYANVASGLKLEFPQIEATTRLYTAVVDLRRGDTESEEHVYWADPNVFSVFHFDAVAGDIANALEKPDGIVLNRTTARKYFGRDQPIGEFIQVDHEHRMQVTAIIDDLPSETSLYSGIFLSGTGSFSPLSRLDAMSRTADRTPNANVIMRAETYLQLKPGASIDVVRRSLPAFTALQIPQGLRKDQRLLLLPIGGVHLYRNFGGAERLNTIYAIASVGILIVLVASINFVNLMTARGARRAIEVGIRKTSGAQRRDIFFQFIGEAIIYAALSAIVAVALVALLLPVVNTVLDRRIVLGLWHDPVLIGSMLGLLGLVGVTAGLYPAAVLSRIRPVAVLKGGPIKVSGSSLIRQSLVVLQFAVLIGLALATGVIYEQTEYGLKGLLRFDHDEVLILEHTSCGTTFKDEILALPGVRGAACSWQGSLLSAGVSQNFGTLTDALSHGSDAETALRAVPSDFGLLELYGLKPMAGRFFSADHRTDIAPTSQTSTTNPSVVINESALHRLGFVSPASAIGHTVTWRRFLETRTYMPVALPSEIIGVVADVASDIRNPITPNLYYVDPAMFRAEATYTGAIPTGMLNIKLSGVNVLETLSSIDRIWREHGDPLPIKRSFLDQWLQQQYLGVTQEEHVLAGASSVAILIACLGLIGLSVFLAECRTKEIGVRKAMGASSIDVLRMLLWQSAKPALWATLIAWPSGAYLMHRWLGGFAQHVALDPLMFVGASCGAVAIALATVVGHAVLVARAQPVAALRYE